VARVIAPSRDDPLVAAATGPVGGPWGRFARGRSVWWMTPMRAVLCLTVLTCVLGYLAKAPCRTHPWANEYQYTRICYTDVFALYYAEQLGAKVNSTGDTVGRLSVPYRDHPVEYPAVIGGLMWTAAEVTNLVHPHQPADGTDTRDRTFFDITALMLALFALATTWALARLAGRRRIWDAAMFALAPMLLFHAYTNWDLAAVALATLGMWAWSRTIPVRRLVHYWPAVLAGLLFGVGVATKLYPALLLVVILALAFRAARLRHALVCIAAAAGGFALAYTPAWLLSRNFPFPNAQCPTAHPLSAWRWFWSLNTIRVSDWDSLWFLGEHARGALLDNPSCGEAPRLLNTGVAIATVAIVLLVIALILLAPRRPRLPQVGFLIVAGFLLVNKVDSPQYVLWLLPLAVLARPRWRLFLLWQATEFLILVARFYFFVGNDAAIAGRSPQGLPIDWFFAAVVIRDVVLMALMGFVVREILRPEHDVVRRNGVDDPAGGILDAAPDRRGRRVADVHLAPA
jgi:uncharacterized membrane protein